MTVMRPGCIFENNERFIEGSWASLKVPFLQQLFKKSRKRESKEKTQKWLRKMSVNCTDFTFFESEKVKPLPDSYIPAFQDAVNAYLFHGVAALAVHPNVDGFYKVLSVARKIGSGTGSIGLKRFYVLLKGKHAAYGNIVLEMKEAANSVLEAYFNYKYSASEEGKRAVNGERSAYPYANLFTGWTTYPVHSQTSYIVTERSKHSVSADIGEMSKQEYGLYAEQAGKALAMYHIRARCTTSECFLQERAMVDTEMCANIQAYVKQYNGSLRKSILEYSVAEAGTETLDLKVLAEWAESHEYALELLTRKTKQIG